MSEQVLSEENIKELKELQDSFMQLTIDLGKTNIERINLEKKTLTNSKKLDELEDTYTNLLIQQDKVIDSLYEKYGNGQVDLEKGVFIQIQE